MSPSVLDLFDRCLAVGPRRTAYLGAGGSTSYVDLDTRARELAGRLAGSGVTAGDRVALALPPGADAVAALLATWRLGAVAVFEGLWATGGGPTVITGAAATGGGSAGAAATGGGSAGAAATGAGARPGSAGAFVDHGFGSTRLVVGQQAVANQVRWAVRRWAVAPGDRILGTARTPATLCFEAFLALASGATLSWAAPDGDAAALVDLAADVGATVLSLPCSAAGTGAGDAGWGGTQPRVVAYHDPRPSGPMPPAWRDAVTTEVWCTYGLAAAGSVLAARRVDADAPDGGPLIGRPVDGVRLALLDEYGEPVPPGVAGELYLAGSCVPLGVDTDAPANADRLLPDPFGAPGGRMLCLGDLARWRTGGALQLLGRAGDAGSGTADHESVRPTPAADPGPMTAAEAVVAGVWSELLGVAPAGARDDFYALGGYSLLIPALAQRLGQAGGVAVPVGELFRASTLAEQAALLGQATDQATGGGAARAEATGAEAARARAAGDAVAAVDARLDPAVLGLAAAPWPVRPAQLRPPRQALLTGATGFLGAFLLAEMLRTWPDVSVVCLVRAASAAQGMARLERAARRYRVWTEAFRERVVPLGGDLEQPRLGLDPARFEELGRRLDLVLHSGARVNLAEPYARLRAVNVLGTHEVLRLAAPGGVPVHLVSTIGVLAGIDGNPEVLDEDRRVGAEAVSANGYLRSKWAADELVRQAGQHGLPTAIYRPARISGHTVTGATGPNDALWVLVRACVEAGVAPHGPELAAARADLVPVDYVARAIVYLCRHRPPDGTGYSLTNPVPTPLMAVLDRVRAAGYRLESVSSERWADRLASAAERADPASALASAAALVGREPHPDRLFPPLRYDRPSTLRGLAGSGIDVPPIGPDLLDRYLRFFIDSGDWPAPPSGRGAGLPAPAIPTPGGRP